MFFDGEIADDTSKIRLVGFDASQQRKLSGFHETQLPIELQNCEIKKPRYGDVYNLMLRSRSVIKESKRAIDEESLIKDHDYATVVETDCKRLTFSLNLYQHQGCRSERCGSNR